jgi:thiol-disulfide isomerase/thioredoxin
MKSYTSWILVAVAVVLIIGSMVWYSSRPGEYDGFAICIKESGAKFFGAFWCPHCQDQKSLFGRSARELPYQECSTPDGQAQLQSCLEEKIETYPTWKFADGTVKKGVVSMAELASITSCEFVKDVK